MTPIIPLCVHEGATLCVFGKAQSPYQPLVAAIDDRGLVLTEWELTVDEFDRLLSGGHVRVWVHTFNRALQPVQVEIVEPECGMQES